MRLIIVKSIRENGQGNATRGITREARNILLEAGVEEVRNMKQNVNGIYTFIGGYGYDVIDCDLLGGDGSGETKKALEDKGILFVGYPYIIYDNEDRAIKKAWKDNGIYTLGK